MRRVGKQLALMVGLIPCLSGSAFAQSPQRLVGTAMFNACTIAITESGDAFLSSYAPGDPGAPQTPWRPAGNLFGSANAGSGNPVVGLTFVNSLGPVVAVCRNGDFYYLGWNQCDEVGATAAGNIFVEAGRVQPGVEIVTVGWGAGSNSRHFYVGASNGDVYRKDGSGSLSPYWQYSGKVSMEPTATSGKSWGELKSAYR